MSVVKRKSKIERTREVLARSLMPDHMARLLHPKECGTCKHRWPSAEYDDYYECRIHKVHVFFCDTCDKHEEKTP